MDFFRKSMFLVVLVCAPVSAHDFWIHADKFALSVGDMASLSLQVGHGPDRQTSPIAAQRIMRFAESTPDGATVDLRKPGARSWHASGEGVHLLVLETDNQAQSHMPAARFNAYLRTEGLTSALSYRTSRKLMEDEGAERYSRIAKALIEVGRAGMDKQALATRALGLKLEIVLDRSPYAQIRSTQLPVHVIFEGRPLVGGLVKLTDLDHDTAPLETHVTDAQGRANFAMPRHGSWLLNVIWTKPVHQGDGIDFETIFSSLSFGVPKSLNVSPP